jgi:hypothetical protein
MRTTITRLLIALVLALAAWVSWSESRLATEVGRVKQSVATLDFAGAAEANLPSALPSYLPGVRGLTEDVQVAKARVAYWLGRYDDVGAGTTAGHSDADILLAAANAAYRNSQYEPGSGPAAIQKLDGVIQAYAAALKAASRNVDAAFNYEYVARQRDLVARAQGKGLKPLVPAVAVGDLPSGPTIHGAPGGPPPDAKMEDLQTIAPMEYGDREAQPQPTPGGKRERKG